MPEHLSNYFSAVQLTPSSITLTMRQGRPPVSLLPSTTAEAKTGLVLVHGYCSETNPWEPSKASFTNGHYFLNPTASITNEQFAAKVIAFASSKNLTSYAMVSVLQRCSSVWFRLFFYSFFCLHDKCFLTLTARFRAL